MSESFVAQADTVLETGRTETAAEWIKPAVVKLDLETAQQTGGGIP